MEDMIGFKCNKLTVISFNRKENTGTYWNCLCECGNNSVVAQSALKRQVTKSCGCGRKKGFTESIQKLYPREWSSWENMHQRCHNLEFNSYPNYGARGIKICERWDRNLGGSFENFYSDMGPRPEGMTLERIDVTLDYSLENCTWATRSQQSWNRNKFSNNTSGKTGVSFVTRNNKWSAYISFEGETIRLGYFENFEDAVKAREEAEIEYYGENKD